jgi:hypothetical protein
VRIIRIGVTRICYRGFCTLRPSVGTDQQNAVKISRKKYIIAGVVFVPLSQFSSDTASPRMQCDGCPSCIGQFCCCGRQRVACTLRQLLRLRCKANNPKDRRCQHIARNMFVVQIEVLACLAGSICKLDNTVGTSGSRGVRVWCLTPAIWRGHRRFGKTCYIFPTNSLLPIWLCCFKC